MSDGYFPLLGCACNNIVKRLKPTKYKHHGMKIVLKDPYLMR